MITGIDHIVILTHDLEAAVDDYAGAGFTVVPGGEHADGRSRNALVSFSDGTYLELIAFRGGVVPETHHFYRPGNHEGLVTYALLPGDIAQTVEDARRGGLAMGEPRAGGRQRPDGKRIEWQISEPPTQDLPFLCFDITPRSLRVPSGEAHQHANGVSGIASLLVMVDDPEASRLRYSALLGIERAAEGENAQASFSVGGADITLRGAAGLDVPPDYIERGQGPVRLTLKAKPGTLSAQLQNPRLRRTGILIEPEPLPVSSISDEYGYISGLRCSRCGSSYMPESQSLLLPPGGNAADVINVRCSRCGHTGSLIFDISSFFGK